MGWHGSVFTLIDLRSFSNVWYWLVVAALWSAVTHNPLGVPFDMVLRARRQGGAALQDLESLVAIQIRRRQTIMSTGGVAIVAGWSATLGGLVVLGFGYGMELAQALTMLAAPMTLVGILRLRLMSALSRDATAGDQLCRRLTWHRTGVQATGLLAILVTALWGMWFNLSIRALGG